MPLQTLDPQSDDRQDDALNPAHRNPDTRPGTTDMSEFENEFGNSNAAPRSDTQPGSTDMSEFENEFANNSSRAGNAAASASQLKDDEAKAADDTLGKGFTGGGQKDSGKKKVNTSTSWWNKKKARIAGFAGVGVFGIGGITGFTYLSGTVLQPIHLAETLLTKPYSRQQSDTQNSQHHWIRSLRALKNNDYRYTRVGTVGASFANSMLTKLDDAGITFSGSDSLGRPTALQFDQEKIAANNPETQGMSESEFADWAEKQYDLPEGSVKSLGNGTHAVDLNGLPDQKLVSIAQTSKDLAADDSLISGLQLRSLKRFWGTNSIFHPLTRALDDKYRAKAAEADAKKSAGQPETPEEGTSSTDPAVETMEEAFNTETAPTTETADAAVSDLSDTANSTSRKIANWAGLGQGQLLIAGCTLDKGAKDIVTIDRVATVLPTIAKVLQLISLASQIKNGGNDVTLAQVSGIMSGLTATTQSDKDTGNKDAGTDIWDGGAMGVLAETATPDKNGVVPNDLKASSKAAFLIDGGGKLESLGKKMEDLSFGGAPVPDKCGAVGAVGQFTLGLVENGLLALLNAPDGETGTVAVNTATRLAISELIKQLPQSLGFGLAEGYAVTQVENYIKDSGAAKALAADAFTGAQGGDLLAYGARAAANLSSAASGGVDIANTATQTLVGSAGVQEQQQFQHESYFARIFDAADTRSLTGQLSMSISPSLSSNTYSLATSLFNVKSSLANTLGTLFSRPSFADANGSSTGTYDWGFDQMGIPDVLQNYDQGQSDEDLGAYLQSACPSGPSSGECASGNNGEEGITTRIKACFGNDLTQSGTEWDVNPEQASSPSQPVDIDTASDDYQNADCGNTKAGGITQCAADVKNADGSFSSPDTNASCMWGRVIVFVKSTSTLKLMDCADGTTDTSAQSCADEGVSTGDATASTTTTPTSFTVAAYNMCQEQNHPHGCPTTNITQKAQDISNVIQGKSGITGNDKSFSIISAQEVSPQTQSAVLADLPTYQSFPQQVPGSQGWAVFWDKTQFSLVGSGQYLPNVYNNVACLMKAGSNCSMPGAPWVELQTSTGQDVYVISVHSPNNNNGGNATIRNHNANVVLDWAKSHTKGNATVIIGGDFNDSPDGTSPNSDYCVLTKDGSLQHVLDMQNGKSGACPSPNMSIEKIFASTANGVSASGWHTLGDNEDSNLTGTDHSPSWSTITTSAAGSTGTYKISSYNVEGASHGYDWPTRIQKVIDIIKSNDVDLVGFQELESSQRAKVMQALGGTYSIYPDPSNYGGTGGGESENSILYNKSEFKVVSGGEQPNVEYFGGGKLHTPYVLMQDLRTQKEFYFLNTHDPAYYPQIRYVDAKAHVAFLQTLPSNIPVVFTGDFNAHYDTSISGNPPYQGKRENSTYCILTANNLLVDAFDAKNNKSGQCPTTSEKGTSGVDHIFLSPGSTVSAFKYFGNSRAANGTDHGPLIITATLGAN